MGKLALVNHYLPYIGQISVKTYTDMQFGILKLCVCVIENLSGQITKFHGDTSR